MFGIPGVAECELGSGPIQEGFEERGGCGVWEGRMRVAEEVASWGLDGCSVEVDIMSVVAQLR